MKRLIFATCFLSSHAWAQEKREAPISDTEDASLNSVEVGDSRLHPVLSVDVRNGDFVRGSYDDDAASLGRVPVHVQVGAVYELTRQAGGDATAWLEVRSSNGIHSPSVGERTSPRAWYESNNLVGLAASLAPGLKGALTYTVKTSPNGISDTTHELSAALSLDRSSGFGWLNPGVNATWRPKGGGGFYTQATIEPGWKLGEHANAIRVSIPAVLGVGWNDFYESDSGTRAYGSAGLALDVPLAIAGGHWSARAEALALVRDDRLRMLGGERADHGTVEPYVTLRLSYAY